MIYAKWMSTPLPTRIAIANVFGISKTGPTHVADNRVVADGYKFEDVERILSVENMSQYLDSPVADIDALFDLVVAKIEGREVPVIQVEPVVMAGGDNISVVTLNATTLEPLEPPKEEKPKRKPRTKKK